MSPNNSEVTPSRLEDILREGELVLRCLQQRTKPTERYPDGMSGTTIVLFNIRRDGRESSSLCEVQYEFVEPSEGHPKGLLVKQLGVDPIVWFDYFEKETIPGWREKVRLWLPAKPAIAIRRGSSVEKEVPIGSLGLIEHYCYFLQRLAYEIKEQPEASADLSLVYQRLTALIKDRVKAWDDLLGQLHV